MATRSKAASASKPQGAASGDSAQDKQSAAEKVFHAVKGDLDYLCGRWQDEQEHEDFAEYEEFMRAKITAAGGEFLTAHKRAFGATFRVEGRSYRISVTARYLRLQSLP